MSNKSRYNKNIFICLSNANRLTLKLEFINFRIDNSVLDKRLANQWVLPKKK